MLTGYETVESIRDALRLGACDYLSKPSTWRIRSAVASAMETAQSFRGNWFDAREDGFIAGRASTADGAPRKSRATRRDFTPAFCTTSTAHSRVIAGYIQLINMDLENTAQQKNRDLDTIKIICGRSTGRSRIALRFHNVTSDFCAGNLRTKPSFK